MEEANAQYRTSNLGHRTQPVALTVAGSDSSAGAGIQADLKTFSALGVYGLTAVTCVVAETPGKVSQIEALSPAFVRQQVAVLANSFPICALKTGLLCNAQIVSTVANAVAELRRNNDVAVVVDPVMIATSGDRLLDPSAITAYEQELFPRATLITPNLDEASHLLGRCISDRRSMELAARELAERYHTSVLLKGGHLDGDVAIDILAARDGIQEFTAEFVRNVKTHGTGCTYSAAITAGLARGESLPEAIGSAKHFVTEAIRTAFSWGTIQALNHRIR